MSDSSPINLTILDKEYVVGASDDEKDALVQAAHELDQRMREIRDSGKVLGSERIAVITALNLAHELQTLRNSTSSDSRELNDTLTRLLGKLDMALQDDISH